MKWICEGRSEVLRADGDRIRDVITSRGNVAKVRIIRVHKGVASPEC